MSVWKRMVIEGTI